MNKEKLKEIIMSHMSKLNLVGWVDGVVEFRPEEDLEDMIDEIINTINQK